MAVFTTEEAVRLKFQVNDTGWVPAALVAACINGAHEEILRRLDPALDPDDPEDALVLGETLLAGARLLESLASKDAVKQEEVVVGGQHIETGKRFASLMAMASKVEKEAWYVLEPYLASQPDQSVGQVTDTMPVIGQTEDD